MISSIETISATSEFSEEFWETFEPPESINLPETNEKEWGFFKGFVVTESGKIKRGLFYHGNSTRTAQRLAMNRRLLADSSKSTQTLMNFGFIVTRNKEPELVQEPRHEPRSDRHNPYSRDVLQERIRELDEIIGYRNNAKEDKTLKEFTASGTNNLVHCICSTPRS